MNEDIENSLAFNSVKRHETAGITGYVVLVMKFEAMIKTIRKDYCNLDKYEIKTFNLED